MSVKRTYIVRLPERVGVYSYEWMILCGYEGGDTVTVAHEKKMWGYKRCLAAMDRALQEDLAKYSDDLSLVSILRLPAPGVP